MRVGLARPVSGGLSQADPLEERLREAGYVPLAFPLTRIDPPADPRPLARGARDLLAGGYDVLLLTSARALPPLVAALEEGSGGRNWVRPEGLEVWVVGTATGEAAAAAGLTPDRIPDRFVAEGLLEAASAWGGLEGMRILFPRAAEGRELLPESLAGAGARITLVEAYRAVEDPEAGNALLAAARRGDLDVIVLTAGSQARVLGGALRRSPGGWPPGVRLVAIGPATRAAAIASGLPEAIVADPHTMDGILQALGSLRGSGSC